MPRNRKIVEAALSSKGFTKVEGDHHYFAYVTRDGRRTRARTKTSHSPKVKDLGDGLLGQMAKQVFLNKQDFLRLVDCPLNREGYEEKLRDQGQVNEA